MRSQAREIAFQLIFERLFVKDSYIQDEEFFAPLKKSEDQEFAKSLIRAFDDNRESLTEIISSKLIGYEIDRVYKVDLAILYLATAELTYFQTPHQIVINEAVELAKKFSTEKSSRFVNGVLSSIVNKVNKPQ